MTIKQKEWIRQMDCVVEHWHENVGEVEKSIKKNIPLNETKYHSGDGKCECCSRNSGICEYCPIGYLTENEDCHETPYEFVPHCAPCCREFSRVADNDDLQACIDQTTFLMNCKELIKLGIE